MLRKFVMHLYEYDAFAVHIAAWKAKFLLLLPLQSALA